MCCCLVFNFTQFVILENLSILDLALTGVKGLTVVGIKVYEKVFLPISWQHGFQQNLCKYLW